MSTGDWFSPSFAPVRRSLGRSAVAASAYICGLSMKDTTTGELHDYSRKKGVLTVHTYTPDGVDPPEWTYDPARLANAMEARETRSNSQVAFSVILPLPAAVDSDARERIGDRFTQETIDRYRLAATAAWHAPDPHGDERNWHLHVLFSTREIGPDGWGKKCRAFNVPPGTPNPKITELRKLAADLINEELDAAGSDERVSHLSFEARGIDRLPTEHLGPTASAMERKGKPSDRGDRNREIAEANRHIADNDRLIAELEAINAAIIAGEEARLDALYSEVDPEKYARELARQTGLPPQLTPGVEADLVARFGDELHPGTVPANHSQPDTPGEATHPSASDSVTDSGAGEPEPPGAGAEASEVPAREASLTAAEPQRVTSWGYAWRAFADRARAWAARLEELWHDEASGGRALSWAQKMGRAARKGFSTIVSRGRTRASDIADEAEHDLEADAEGPPSSPERDPRDGRLWAEKERESREERDREPDDRTPIPPADPILDALWEDWEPSEPEDFGPPPPEPDEPDPDPDTGPDIG